MSAENFISIPTRSINIYNKLQSVCAAEGLGVFIFILFFTTIFCVICRGECEVIYWGELHQVLNPLTAKLFNLNFHPLEVVSRWRDSQLQVSENYSDLSKWSSTVLKYCWLMSHFIFNMFKRWYLGVLSSWKKSKKPRKTRKCVGGSSPNSDYYHLGDNFVFFVCFCVVFMLQKKIIKNR